MEGSGHRSPVALLVPLHDPRAAADHELAGRLLLHGGLQRRHGRGRERQIAGVSQRSPLYEASLVKSFFLPCVSRGSREHRSALMARTAALLGHAERSTPGARRVAPQGASC